MDDNVSKVKIIDLLNGYFSRCIICEDVCLNDTEKHDQKRKVFRTANHSIEVYKSKLDQVMNNFQIFYHLNSGTLQKFNLHKNVYKLILDNIEKSGKSLETQMSDLLGRAS